MQEVHGKGFDQLFVSSSSLVIRQIGYAAKTCFGGELTLGNLIMDFHDKSDIETAFREIENIFGSGIFDPKNMGHPLFKPAFVGVLVPLRDLMYKAEKYAKRIDFSDDVTAKDKVKDVSDLIKFVRDAMCHPDSDNHYIEEGMKASFNVQVGKGTLIKINDFEQANPYADDVCFFFGSQRIFLKRHILRAVTEAHEILDPLIVMRYQP